MEPKFEMLPPGSSRPRIQPPKRNRGGIIGGLIAVGAMLFKFAVPLLVFIKTGGTMILSVAAYCIAFGWSWQLAIAVVVLILVHEMGHFIAAKMYHLPVSAPMFIPFVGAYVMHANPFNSWITSVISYAGPLAGGLGGWACLYLGIMLDNHWLIVGALYTFFLNLVNLAPIPPLDGSKIWIAFSRRWTPTLTASDRAYMGIFLAALIAGLLLGCLLSWRYLHPVS